MSGLTQQLGEFVAVTRFEELPQVALPLVRDAFTDTIGVMMAGAHEPVVDIVRRTLLSSDGPGEARVCLSDLTASAFDAALVGATAAHALDYDDQSLTGHPSAVLVPAVLAEGEVLGSSGYELVTAYVVGYEVWADLVRRDGDYHRRGWHPTSVFGAIGAAAAAASLRHLPAQRAAAALSIAASHASGVASNFGTMTKPYHAGLASRAGIVSARLAAAGMSAGNDAIENPQGFLTAISSGAPDRDSPAQAGKDWYLPRHRLCVKKYPTCYFMHRSFDAAVKLLTGRRVAPEEIREIVVTMGRGQTAVLTNERPRNALEAKFSEQFAMAAAVLLGRMGLEELTDDTVGRSDIQAFFPKIRLNPVNESDPRDAAHSPTERVVIRLTDGETLDSGAIATIRGHAYDPLSTSELCDKFLACTSRTHTAQQARSLFAQLQAIDRLLSVRALPVCEALFRCGGMPSHAQLVAGAADATEEP